MPRHEMACVSRIGCLMFEPLRQELVQDAWIHCDDFSCHPGSLSMETCHSKVSKRPSTKVSLSCFIPFLMYLKLAAETGHLFEYFVNRRQHVIKMAVSKRPSVIAA